MKKIRQTNFYTVTASVSPKMLRLQRRSADAALSIMHKKTSFNPRQRRSADAVTITFYERRSANARNRISPTLKC